VVYSRSFGGDPRQSLLFKRGPCPQLRRDITVRCQWGLCRACLRIVLHHHHFNFSSQVGRRARLVGSQSLPTTQHHLNLTTANDSYPYHLPLGPASLRPHLHLLILHVLIPSFAMLDPCRVDPTVSPPRTQPSQLAVYIVSLLAEDLRLFSRPRPISHRSPVPTIGAIPHGLGVLATPLVSTTSPSFKSVHVQRPQIVPPPRTFWSSAASPSSNAPTFPPISSLSASSFSPSPA
jgi:hypothetical protein